MVFPLLSPVSPTLYASCFVPLNSMNKVEHFHCCSRFSGWFAQIFGMIQMSLVAWKVLIHCVYCFRAPPLAKTVCSSLLVWRIRVFQVVCQLILFQHFSLSLDLDGVQSLLLIFCLSQTTKKSLIHVLDIMLKLFELSPIYLWTKPIILFRECPEGKWCLHGIWESSGFPLGPFP